MEIILVVSITGAFALVTGTVGEFIYEKWYNKP